MDQSFSNLINKGKPGKQDMIIIKEGSPGVCKICKIQ